MNMLKSLANLYITIRSGVEFYYFGSGCIADYYGNSIAYLSESDIAVIFLCTGTTKISEIESHFIQGVIDNDVLNKIERLRKKGVLTFSDAPQKKEPVFHGSKGLYYPKELAIELTNICNYGCPFCYKNAKAEGEFISNETISKIDAIIHNNVAHILLTGGEPTLHPNYLKFIELFSQYAKVHMISNGSILYDHDPDILRKLELIQFSIYGCDDIEYLKMTGMRDGFTRLCRSIEFTRKNGIAIKAAVTLCDETLDHIELFVKLAVDFGIKSIRIGIADIFGRGKYLFDASNDFVERRNEAYDVLLALKRKYRNKISFELPNIDVSHVSGHEDIYENIQRNSLNCGSGSEYLVISQKGEIRPCQMLPDQWFSVKRENGLLEHIKGDFHIEALDCAVKKYYANYNFTALKLSPCQALEAYMASKE